MVSKVSEGIKISVETVYQPEFSNPLNGEHLFAYHIYIENNNNFPVQLLKRHWFIYDTNLTTREVEGDGVVGAMPSLQPGEYYEYMSACNLKTEIGRMVGTYEFLNLNTRQRFKAQIPSFDLITNAKLN